MKELEARIQDKQQVAEVAPVKRTNLLARLHPQKGHVCFEMNIETGKITEAQYLAVDVNMVADGKVDGSVTKKLVVKPGYMYTTALNKHNAFKKFVKAIK